MAKQTHRLSEKMAEANLCECRVCGALHARDEDHAYEYANVDSIEIDLIDAITAQPIVDGVQLPCEHMFSRRSLLQWLATNHVCPVCRSPAAASDLKPVVRFAKNKLDELLVCLIYVINLLFSQVCGFDFTIQLDVTFYFHPQIYL